MDDWPRLSKNLERFDVRAHIEATDWNPPGFDEGPERSLTAKKMGDQDVVLSVERVEEGQWHVWLTLLPTLDLPAVGQHKKLLAAVRRHIPESVRWDLRATYNWRQARSVIPLPITVRDQGAEIRGLRIAASPDTDEGYTVVIDRPGKDLFHQVMFTGDGQLEPESVQRWMRQSRNISQRYLLRTRR